MAALAATMVNSVARQTKELDILARQAGITASELQAYSFATESVGISAEKMSDIYKDVFDRIGDYAETGGGPLADFMENVASKTGLTIDALQKMSGPDALQAMKNAMDEANKSAKEQVFYMEALASDASRLIPLLANNGEQFKTMSDRAKELGLVLSEFEVDQLKQASAATKELAATFTALKQQVAAALAPIYTAIAKFLTQAMLDFNKSVSSAEITGWAKESALAVSAFAEVAITGLDAVYRAANGLWGGLKTVYAGIFQTARGVTYLGLQVAKLRGDEAAIDEWATSFDSATKIVEDSVGDAAEAFDRMKQGLPFADSAKNKINQLKEQIEQVDANIIDKNIKDPLKDLKKPLQDVHNDFEDIWTNGGGEAIKALNGANDGMDEFNAKAREAYQNMKKIAGAAKSISPNQYSSGGGVGMKLGGAIKAQAGRFFPGFGGGDKIPILGEAGEFMINKFAVRDAGVDTTAAYNRKDWGTVISNLFKMMSAGGPVHSGFSGPALQMADGGAVMNPMGESVRNYYIQGEREPISVRASDREADRLMSALLNRYRGRSGGAR